MKTQVSAIALLTGLLAAGAAAAQTAPAQDPTATTVDEVIVIGQRAALERAQQIERRADNLVSAIAADDIGQFADQNVAESLQRVSGVVLERSEGEGRFVSIRGLPSSYTPVTINGVRLATSDEGSSEVALDSIGSDQLSSIEVSKSILPNQDADTIGGTVNLNTISAFSRGGADRFDVRLEGYYNDFADAWGPEAAINASRRFMDGTLGIAGSLSFSERTLEGDDLQNTQNITARTAGGRTFFRAEEIDPRREVGERTRFNAALNIEYRPDENRQFFLRGSYGTLEDNDIQYQDEWEIRRSTGARILEIRPNGGRFDDVDLEKQLFVRENTDTTITASAGGLWRNDDWQIDYRLDYASAELDQPFAFRGRFVANDILAEVTEQEDNVTVRGFTGLSGLRNDPRNPAAYRWDQVLLEPFIREDEVITGSLDVRRNVEWFGPNDFLAAGVRYRTRDKSVDRNQQQGNPSTVGLNRTLADLPLENIPTGFDNDPNLRFFPQREALIDLLRQGATALAADPLFTRADNAFGFDYTVGEDVLAAYVMGQFDLTESLRLIAGVRVEETTASSTGNLVEYDDDNGRGPAPFGSPSVPGIVVALPEVEKSYTDWFPSAHLRWEPREDIVARASYVRALQRPDFDERANTIRIDFLFPTAGNPNSFATTRDLTAGNPNLEPLIADQFDASVTFYPTPDLTVQVAAYYKDIENFFFDFGCNRSTTTTSNGCTIGDLGLTVPAPYAPPTGIAANDTRNFEEISTTLNGEKATVTGIEVSYSQGFTMLPGFLSGLFAQANVTLIDSEATITQARVGEKFRLPEQPDIVANVSLGWENEVFSIRVAGNHKGEALSSINSNPIRDRFYAAYESVDVNLRWNVTPDWTVYFDAANLNEAGDVELYRGENGLSRFRRAQYYGSTYQLGLRARF
jgi:iron complex outermembrane recepter protein